MYQFSRSCTHFVVPWLQSWVAGDLGDLKIELSRQGHPARTHRYYLRFNISNAFEAPKGTVLSLTNVLLFPEAFGHILSPPLQVDLASKTSRSVHAWHLTAPNRAIVQHTVLAHYMHLLRLAFYICSPDGEVVLKAHVSAVC